MIAHIDDMRVHPAWLRAFRKGLQHIIELVDMFQDALREDEIKTAIVQLTHIPDKTRHLRRDAISPFPLAKAVERVIPGAKARFRVSV